ncbi:hypothetical protein, partial [Lactococcus petauri]|uniref:hypothetical protein n=1 Tax=Lactococcus petauri TaxID=1940789 RepID=UPI003F693084|nr:hypothetical protein [Lactococcus petauri]
LFVVDQGNNNIRKITPDGTVSTFAGTGVRGFEDGNVNEAKFDQPTDIAIDRSGNLFVADFGNSSIRKITPDGVVST